MVSSASAQIETVGGQNLKTTIIKAGTPTVVPDYAKVQGIFIGVVAAFVVLITIVGPEYAELLLLVLSSHLPTSTENTVRTLRNTKLHSSRTPRKTISRKRILHQEARMRRRAAFTKLSDMTAPVPSHSFLVYLTQTNHDLA